MDRGLSGEIFKMATRSRGVRKRSIPFVQLCVAMLMAVFFAISLISALCTRVPIIVVYIPRKFLVDFAFFSVFLSQVFAFVHNLIVIVCMIPDIFRPVKLIVETIIDDISLDSADVEKLVKYKKYDLKHAIERIDLGVKHVRSRLSILCGAIDKVGIIPAIITWSIAYINYMDKVSSDVLYVVGVAISFSFIMGVLGEIALHKVEEVLCVLKVALSCVEENEKCKNGVQSSFPKRNEGGISGGSGCAVSNIARLFAHFRNKIDFS